MFKSFFKEKKLKEPKIYTLKRTPIKKKVTGRQVHRFTKTTQNEIFERDGWKCIICPARTNLSAHHVLWHEHERLRDGTQNEARRGVTLCITHHTGHKGVHQGNKEADALCHTYITNL